MPKLYLVGVTEDRDGLVLAKSPRAKSGDSVLEVDADVLDAIAEIRRYRSETGLPPSISSPALPTRHRPTGEGSSASGLSPREIQSRLRRGESIESVARRAGIEAWRVEVYAAPIAAEQARIVARARELDMDKRGAGPSGRSLGDSVQANVVEKRVSMNADDFESAWSAYEPEPDRWVVQFQYTSRGRDQLAEWTYDPDEEVIAPANRLATTLGWRDPKKPGRLRPLPEAPRSPQRAAPNKRAPAQKKPVAKKSSKKKAPARKKQPAKKQPAKKRAAKKRAAPKKRVPAQKKPVAKKSSKKKAPATKKAPAKQQPAKKRAARKKPPAKKSGAKKRSTTPSSSKRKRSKAPPARSRSEGVSANWRDELARRVAEDRAATGGRRPSWRVVPDASEPDDDLLAGDDSLDLPSWVPASRGEDGLDDETDEGIDDGIDDGPGDGGAEPADGDDDRQRAGADPTRSHVRVVAPRVSDAKEASGRRRRFRRARRAE